MGWDHEGYIIDALGRKVHWIRRFGIDIPSLETGLMTNIDRGKLSVKTGLERKYLMNMVRLLRHKFLPRSLLSSQVLDSHVIIAPLFLPFQCFTNIRTHT
jgi:hypothetical protein